MAIREEVIIDVTEKGYSEVTSKAEALAKANTKVAESSKEVSASMSGSANSVLENGGAMGLLNDVTGGFAMTVKDAVEASVLFTKSQKLAAIQQKIYTAAVGTSSGAMKIFRLALISTGIGAIVVGIGMLIANFDKVKKVVMNLVPGLKAITELFGGMFEAITDFVGATSDASREVDKMVDNANAALKRNEHFLEANGDKFDQYTQRKLKARIDYEKKVKEIAEEEAGEDDDEEEFEREKLKRMADFRKKYNREIIRADEDREAELAKKREEAAEKEADQLKKEADKREAEEKKRADEAKRKADEAIAKEKERVSAIEKILEDYRKRVEDANAKSNTDKINLEESRALAELQRLKATEEEKAKVVAYYNNLRIEEAARLKKELEDIEKGKQDAERSLLLDQKEWEADNETDPVLKLEKQKKVMEEQGEWELEKIQRDIDNANLSAQERANAEIEYARVKQELNQSLEAKDKEIAEEQKVRDEAVAQNKMNVALNTVKLLADLGGKGAEFAKGMAVAQAIQDTYKGAPAAYSALAGIPIVGPALGAVAAGAVIAAGLQNVKKILSTKPVEKGAPSAGASAGASVPAAPSFNLVQGTGSNQIAEAVANSGNKPVEAYVVSSNVTTAQGVDRNIIENSQL